MAQQSLIFDSKQIEIFRQRAWRNSAQAPSFLLKRAAKELEERISLVNRSFSNALDLHSYNNAAQEALLASGKVDKITRVETNMQFLQGAFNPIVAPREELNNLPRSVDLIVSLLSMQLINDMPKFLKSLLQRLDKDGLFLACFLGGNTLFELRTSFMEAELELFGGASARVAPFISLKDMGDLLHRAGFAMPVVDSEELVVYYRNSEELVADLRLWGMQNALWQRDKRPISRKLLSDMHELYKKKFSRADGAVAASFEIIWLSAWAPHELQQKPAVRGSGQVSLASILSEKSS